MNRKFIALVAVLAVTVALVACDKNSESNRQVVTVSSMNNSAPFFSDVMDQGDTLFVGGLPYTPDDFIQEDWIPVTFYNRRYNQINITAEGRPFSDFLITGYRVEWRRVDGGPAAEIPPPYTGATSIRCPIDEFTTGFMLLVPYEVKNLPYMANINYLNGGFPDEYLMIATVTFIGHDIGTERNIEIVAELTVNFGDPVVTSEDS